MPIFKRPDGELVPDESHVRRMIPYLMRGRNESAIYHDEYYDLTLTKPWLKTWNQHHDQAATLFHLLLWAFAQGFHKRPGLNRFVSGGRIYQRRGVYLSFAAKKRMRDDSPLRTIKLDFPEGQPFGEAVKRIVDSIDDQRSEKMQTTDRELKLAMALPGPLLRVVMAVLRGLDKMNLLPAAMIAPDPMYASAFVANLGSVGLDNTYHHLYEYGTISLFSVIGMPKKMLFVGPNDQPIVKDGVQIRWSFDERINDGFYCALALRVAQRIVENPEKYIGDPKANATRHPNVETPVTEAPSSIGGSNGTAQTN